MSMFDNIKDKATDHINENPDQARDAVEKGGDFVDEKTGNKYAEHVDKAQDAANKHLGGDSNPQQPEQQR